MAVSVIWWKSTISFSHYPKSDQFTQNGSISDEIRQIYLNPTYYRHWRSFRQKEHVSYWQLTSHTTLTSLMLSPGLYNKQLIVWQDEITYAHKDMQTCEVAIESGPNRAPWTARWWFQLPLLWCKPSWPSSSSRSGHCGSSLQRAALQTQLTVAQIGGHIMLWK